MANELITEPIDVALNGVPGESDSAPVAPITPAAPQGSQSSSAQPRREIIPGYQLIEHIGAGGYGEVWRCEAPGGLAKAIKIVHGQFDQQRATDEMKALVHIKDVRHPFLLSLERIEVVNGQLVVVTELADANLMERFEDCKSAGRPGISREKLLQYLGETADALDYMASEHGLAHLDIKPENLLLVGDHIKVADFGLVKNVHGASVSMIGGLTPMFAAPETFDGRPSDRSDQYSLAIVYQLLLTGQLPFRGNSLAQLATQHINARPHLDSLPDADRTVIARALSKDPYDRYPCCRDLIERLRGNAAVSSLPSGGSDYGTPSGQSAIDDHGDCDFKTEVIEFDDSAGVDTRTTSTLKSPATAGGTIVDLPPFDACDSIGFRPSLFVGLGGCGAKILQALAGRLQSRFGPLDEIPSLRMLLIDTDVPAETSSSADREHGEISGAQFEHVPLRQTQYYRRSVDELTRWLSRRWIYNIPKSLSTDGIRPLGRLALVDHIQRIEDRLEEELTEMCSPDAVAATRDALGCDMEESRPRVFFVGSISGATGGGIVWDVAQLVYQALRQHENLDAQIIPVLAHWSSTQAKELELTTVNACANLRELHHYLCEGFPGDTSCHLPPVGRHHGLLENTYLVDLGTPGSDEEFQEAADVLAEYLDVNTQTVAGNFAERCRQAGDGDRSPSSVRTCGIARIEQDDLIAAEETARQLVSHSLRNWTVHTDASARAKNNEANHSPTSAEDIAERISQESRVSFDPLLETLQERLRERALRLGEHWLTSANKNGGKLTARSWQTLIAEIDDALPCDAELDGAGRGDAQKELLASLAEILRDRTMLLQKKVADLVDDPDLRIGLANVACERLVERLKQAHGRASKASGEIAAQLQELRRRLTGTTAQPAHGNVSREILSKYIELRQFQCTLGWLQLITELLQGSLVKTADHLVVFRRRVTALANRLASSGMETGDHPEDHAERSERARNLLDASFTDTLRVEFSDALEQDLKQQFGSLSKMIFSKSADLEAMANRALTLARRRVTETVIERQIEALQPELLSCGGARRYVIVANEVMQKAGLVDLIRKVLPAEPTILSHEKEEMILLCEAQNVPIGSVAWKIADERADLLELAARLPTRIDVAWSPW